MSKIMIAIYKRYRRKNYRLILDDVLDSCCFSVQTENAISRTIITTVH